MNFALWSNVIVLVAVLLAAVVIGYSWSRHRPTALFTLAWIGSAIVLSLRGFFQNPSQWSERDMVGFMMFGTIMTIPLVLFFIGRSRSQAFREFTDNIPLPLLLGIEIYRVAGWIFLAMRAEGLVPNEMGYFTGFMDVFIGVTALPVMFAVMRNLVSSRLIAIVWNLLGISDFVIAVSMVSLSIFGLIAFTPDPVMIGFHPLALIALFQLPLSIMIHVLALRQLFTANQPLETGATDFAITGSSS